jgi:hypothetical protein
MSIYIIKSIEPSLHDCYIGSCKNFRRRRREHKSNCYNENSRKYNFKLYQYIRSNGGWDNFIMEELCKCDVERLYQVEQEYIDKYKSSLNCVGAYRSEEYYVNYYIGKNKQNSEIKKEKFKCECGSTLRKTDKQRHLKTIKHQSYISNNPEYLTRDHNPLEN